MHRLRDTPYSLWSDGCIGLHMAHQLSTLPHERPLPAQCTCIRPYIRCRCYI